MVDVLIGSVLYLDAECMMCAATWSLLSKTRVDERGVMSLAKSGKPFWIKAREGKITTSRSHIGKTFNNFHTI